MPEYLLLKRFIVEEIINSNLAYSTVMGTGFRSMNLDGRRRLPAQSLLVQIVAVTETREANNRVFNLKLSDGDTVVDAIAFGLSSSCDIGFYELELGFKVSHNYISAATMSNFKG